MYDHSGFMGVSRGGQEGGECLVLDFENDDVTCCSPVKYPKFFADVFGKNVFGARFKYT